MNETKSMPGPCCICGSTNYALSMGGPSVCPKCDCGHFDFGTVFQQAKVIERLRAALNELGVKSVESDQSDEIPL